jgi:hypothetical protein
VFGAIEYRQSAFNEGHPNVEAVTLGPERREAVSETVIVGSGAASGDGVLVRGAVSLVEVAGMALLVPLVILLIGSSVVLVGRGVVEAARAILTLIFR